MSTPMQLVFARIAQPLTTCVLDSVVSGLRVAEGADIAVAEQPTRPTAITTLSV